MPVIAEKIEPAVFAALKDAYTRKCGASPGILQKYLDDKFKEELKLLTDGQKGAQGSHLISDKTLRNFFSSNNPQMKGQYLNYLCIFLLERSSYQDAIEYLTNPVLAVMSNHNLNIQDFSWWESYKRRIEEKCNKIRIPHMTKSIPVKDIYVDTECSEEIRERRRKTASQMQAEMAGTALSQIKRVQADQLLTSSTRLMLWGRSGSGKTTFLKHLALEKIQESSVNQIPIFIELRDLVRHQSEISNLSGIAIAEVRKVFQGDDLDQVITDLIRRGKLMFILDGLDEIKEDKREWISNLIVDCLDKFPDNTYIVSCRPTEIDYIHPSFHDVEVVEFSESQVENFVKQWFAKSDEKNLDQRFLAQLKENDAIAKIAQTPLLLTQLCSTYQYGYDFPRSKSGLLEDAVDLYLRKWDSFRRIDRSNILKNVSRSRTKGLFTQIAYWSMDRKLELLPKGQLEAVITDYTSKLPTLEKIAAKDQELILKELESSFGILVQENRDEYAFIHKSFQEYLLAQHILNDLASEKITFEELFQKHLLDRAWRSAILWMSEGLSDASEFLKALFQFSLELSAKGCPFYIDHSIKDSELSTDHQLTSVLEWLDRITSQAEVSTSSWRACILSYNLETDMHIARSTPKLDHAPAQRLAEKTRELHQRYEKIAPRTDRMKLLLDLAVIHALASDKERLHNPEDFDYLKRIQRYDPTYGTENIAPKLAEARSIVQQLGLGDLEKSLAELSRNIPSVVIGEEWKIWADSLQEIMKAHLDEGYGIILDDHTVHSLNDLIYVTHLIVECLLGDIYCGEKGLPQQIFASLLLPATSDKIPKSLREIK